MKLLLRFTQLVYELFLHLHLSMEELKFELRCQEEIGYGQVRITVELKKFKH